MDDAQLTGFEATRPKDEDGQISPSHQSQTPLPDTEDPSRQVPPATAPGTDLQVIDLGEDAGAGLEDLRMEEQLTPFLRILQKGSPQVDPAAPEYDDRLRAGMIYNTATQEAYDGREGVEVVVAARDPIYGMWVPRDSGGGFRGMLKWEDPIVLRGIQKYGRFKKIPHVTEDGEAVELVQTIQFYVLYAPHDLTDANAQRAIISMSSTAMPVAQRYLSKHNTKTYFQKSGQSLPAALWQYKWRFSLVPQQNASGSWFNWKDPELLPPGVKIGVEALIPRTSPLFLMGKEFNAQYRSGQAKPDFGDAKAADNDLPPF